MPITKACKYAIKARAQTDQAFRIALLEEALDAALSNDLEPGKLLCAITSTPLSASMRWGRNCARAPRA